MAFGLISSNDPQNIANEMNKNILELKNNEVVQYFKDDTGTRRVMLGKGPSGFYGLKVSQEGYDVYTASNDELVFNSDNNVFKIIQSGTATLGSAADGTTTEVTVAHNLGFVPVVMAYLTDSGSSISPLPSLIVESAGAEEGKVLQVISWYADTTNVTFYNQSNLQSTAGGTIKYYILQETAN